MNYTNQPDSIEGLTIQYGLIQFDSYLHYKTRAAEVREYLQVLDVSPDNEQEVKKTVAAARKIADQLNEAKIRAKKTVLEPYSRFEDQVKEIIGIITEGENVARDKLKDIDNQRREEKKEKIREIWDKRIGSFDCADYITFDNFLEDRHLNKTVSIGVVEDEMVKFLAGTSADIQILRKKPNCEEYLDEYKQNLNLAKTLEIVDSRHERIERIAMQHQEAQRQEENSEKEKKVEPYIVIKVTGKAGIILAKQLLSDIDYEIVEEK